MQDFATDDHSTSGDALASVREMNCQTFIIVFNVEVKILLNNITFLA